MVVVVVVSGVVSGSQPIGADVGAGREVHVQLDTLRRSCPCLAAGLEVEQWLQW